MNNFNHHLYILTEHDDIYRQAIENTHLDGLTITDNRAEATILLAAPPMAASCINDFPNVEWVQSVYAGVDALTLHPKRTDYLLTNIKGIFGQLISEYVIGYIISHYRHFPLYRQQQSAEQWTPHLYESLSGKVMAILGTGSIGSHLSHAASGLGIDVIGINSSGIPPKAGKFSRTYHANELSAALSQANIIVNTLPDTEQTRGLINEEVLSHCFRTLVFNVGRGKTVVESDLLNAIDKGYVEHAFLDVFEQEPLPEQHPYWKNHAITVTPHIAALSFPSQVLEQFIHNYDLWCTGFRLDNEVSFDKGY
ncbi:D-2-hydroxyacid dehydrogenase [Vibrio nitrifigilis]|uniref:D-2-hydroxyacid dehydrogenase n=1 Tax=Vibrio nitrifigilis TaxID=2789781 RepID=A0ABS0GFN5_9VIBR|nr:D-2-hydroxyacid dehydrogenase [Vibrio nitrifigilis]MBF9001229.1 D-2-hydroxyacid dehydrogenase [Vibrio nitrifigilis]